jgi:predicted SprT family Zn-dependent metalloprotease
MRSIAPTKQLDMDLNKAKQVAVELMEEHNLMEMGWRFGFDTAKRRFGCCNYTYKEITLSRALVLVNDEDRVKNTILHEIAHALVGRGHGHNSVWKRKAIEIGCDGKRCYTTKNTSVPESKYVAVCKSCGHVHRKHRASTKTTACGICCKGVFQSEYILTFKLNPKYQ